MEALWTKKRLKAGRYNTFFVLYPLGISSECWLVYRAIAPAKAWNPALEWVLKGILFIYVPGTFLVLPLSPLLCFTDAHKAHTCYLPTCWRSGARS